MQILNIWSGLSLLLSWLFGTRSEKTQELPPLAEQHAKITMPVRNAEERLTRLRAFENLLRPCRNYDEVRVCALEEGLNLGSSSNLSRLVFNHLLNIRAPLDMLLKFLEDTLVGSEQTHLLLFLLLRSRIGDDYNQDMVCAWIHEQASRGYLSEKEIRSLLKGTTLHNTNNEPHNTDNEQHNTGNERHSTSNEQHNTSNEQHNTGNEPHNTGNESHNTGNKPQQVSPPLEWQVYWSIWKGLRSSLSHNLRDLRFDTLHIFVQTAARIAPVDQGSQMIIDIASVLDGQKSKEMVPAILEFMKRSSGYQEHTPNATIQDRTCGANFPRLLQLLNGLPHHTSAECVVRLSADVILKCSDDDSTVDWHYIQVRDWLSMLGIDLFQRARKNSRFKKKWQVIEEHLTTLQPGFLMLYLRLFEEGQTPPFLQEYMTLHAQNGDSMPVQERNAIGTSSTESKSLISEDTKPASGSRNQPETEEPYINIIRNMLVSYPSLLTTTLPEVLSDLRRLAKWEDILLIVRHLHDRKFPIQNSVLAHEVVEHSKINPVFALKLFRAWPPLRIAHCPGFMDAIISDPRIRPGTPLNLFYRDSPNLQATRRYLRQSRPLPLKHDQALLLHEMAVAFAQAAHLKPREALRKVMRCFYQFIGHFDLVKPQMTEAMVAAGIIRYLEAGLWVSTTSLKRILAIVRQVEGEKVAEEIDRMVYVWRGRVVRSRIYRETMWKKFAGIKEREDRKVYFRKTFTK